MHPPRRVLLLDTKRSDPNRYLSLALRDAFQTHPGVAAAELVDYGDAVERARGGDWDLFVAFGGEEMDEALCAKVVSYCRRSVLWVTEDPYERKANFARARLFDLVLTNDSASADAYGPGRARHLPLAASEAWHLQALPEPSGEGHRYLYDVFFAGTAWPNRVRLLRELTAGLPNLKYKLALPSNPYLPVPDLGVNWPGSALRWRVPNSEFCRIANRSRITLGLHRDFAGDRDNPSLSQTPGPRLFEIAMAGGFQLVDGDLPEVGNYYLPGQDYASFTGAADCLKKVRYYLQHPREREAMAQAAQDRTQAEHTYRHRVDRILGWVDELPETGERAAVVLRKRRNLLFVAHNTLVGGHFGGVEVVMDLLARELGGEFDIFFYAPLSRGDKSVGAVLYGPGLVELQRFDFAPIQDNVLLSDPARESAFAQVLSDCAIDLVHYHHLMRHVASLPLVSRAYGVPATLTVYDYFHACVCYNLLDHERKFCRIEDKPITTCDICLNAQFHYLRGAQERRRAFFARVLDAVEGLVFISRDCRDRTQKIYRQTRLEHKSLVVDLPVPYAEDTRVTGSVPERWKTPLRVVSFGNFTHAKGADVMLRAFNQMRDSPFEFHLYGRADEPYPAVFDALKLPNVFVHRQFDPGSLREVLAQAAFSLHLSVWPETFCITVAEAMHFGVVPIVSDLGAPAERIIDGVNGFKIPAGEPGALLDLLDRLAADPSPAIRIHEHLAGVHVQGAREHAAIMGEHYRRLLDAVPPPPTGFAGPQGDSLSASLTLEDCGVTLVNPAWPQGLPIDRVTPTADPAPGEPPPDSDPALFFNPVYIWRRALYQTRTRGWRGSLRWHSGVLWRLVRLRRSSPVSPP